MATVSAVAATLTIRVLTAAHVLYKVPLDEALDRPRWLIGRTWGSPHGNLMVEGRFDGHLIEAIYRDLAPVLPSGYTIDTAVRSYVVLMEAEGKKEHLAKPDVAVTEPAATKRPSTPGATSRT